MLQGCPTALEVFHPTPARGRHHVHALACSHALDQEGKAHCRPAEGAHVAGGPVVSIVVGIAALVAWTLPELPDAMFTDPGSLRGALALGSVTLGLFSCGLSLSTMLPRNQGTFASDGSQILSLRRPNAAADRYAAVMALGNCMMAGMRPRDWHPELVGQAVSLADGSRVDLAGRHMAYEHALDRGDVPAARGHIRYLVGHIRSAPTNFRSVISTEAAYFEAAYDGNAASARRRLTGIWKRGVHAFDGIAVLYAEGAVLLAEGDAARASDKLRQAHAARASSHDRSSEIPMAEIRRLCRAPGLPLMGR